MTGSIPSPAATVLYITRTGLEAERLRRRGFDARPVHACCAGQRWDKLVLAFDIDSPIPGLDESTEYGRRKAAEQRDLERLALREFWPLKKRLA